jgi:hypothetical protein
MAPPGTMVYSILDRGIQFFQEKKNRERIQEHFVDPLVKYVLDRMFPYIILTCILFSMILLLSIISVGLLMFQLHNASKIVTALPESITKTMAIINE